MNRALNANLAVEDPDTNGLYEWCNLRAGRMSSLGGLGPNSLHPERDPHPDNGRGLLMHADLDMNGYTVRNGVFEGGGGGGEANAGFNLGAVGAEIYRDKSGILLNFRKIRGTEGINLTQTSETLDLSINTSDLYGSLDGIVYSEAGGGLQAKKSEFAAAVPPSATDDSTQSFEVGSRWIDIANNKEYVCLNNSAAAALWKNTTTPEGGGASQKHWDAVVVGNSGQYGPVDNIYTYSTLQDAVTAQKYNIRILANTPGAVLQSGDYVLDVSSTSTIQSSIVATLAFRVHWTGGKYLDVLNANRFPIINTDATNDIHHTVDNVHILHSEVTLSPENKFALPNHNIVFRRCTIFGDGPTWAFFGLQGRFENCVFKGTVHCYRDQSIANEPTSTSFHRCFIDGDLKYTQETPANDRIFTTCWVTECDIRGELLLDNQMDVCYFMNNKIGTGCVVSQRLREVTFAHSYIGTTNAHPFDFVAAEEIVHLKIIIDDCQVASFLQAKKMDDSIIRNCVFKDAAKIDTHDNLKFLGNTVFGQFTINGPNAYCTVSNNTFYGVVETEEGTGPDPGKFNSSTYSNNNHANISNQVNFRGEFNNSHFQGNTGGVVYFRQSDTAERISSTVTGNSPLELHFEGSNEYMTVSNNTVTDKLEVNIGTAENPGKFQNCQIIGNSVKNYITPNNAGFVLIGINSPNSFKHNTISNNFMGWSIIQLNIFNCVISGNHFLNTNSPGQPTASFIFEGIVNSTIFMGNLWDINTILFSKLDEPGQCNFIANSSQNNSLNMEKNTLTGVFGTNMVLGQDDNRLTPSGKWLNEQNKVNRNV
jgi:hypothetical protein